MNIYNLFKLQTLPLLFMVTFLSAKNYSQAEITTEFPSSNEMIIHFSLDSIENRILTQNQASFSYIEIAGLGSVNIPGQPKLPVVAKNLNAYPKHIQYRINIKETEQLILPYEVIAFQDFAKGQQMMTGKRNADKLPFPENTITTTYQGLIKDHPLTTLYFYPIQVLSKNRVNIIKEAEIFVKFTNISPSTFQPEPVITTLFDSPSRFANPKNVSKSSLNPLFDTPFVRFEVSEDGVYRVTYDQLKKAGLPIGQVDPQGFALYNQGRQVPLYVHGEKDHVFHKKDYIEFIGKRNPNSTGNTSEYDPFTNDNVYQLYWNINRGLRFALESVTPDYEGRDLIKPVEFDDLYHFEKNEYFQRLGYTYSDILSIKNDQYFFGEKIFSGSSKDFEFILPSPNTNTTKNIEVKVKLQSLSQHVDPTATILINGQNIGKNTWPWRSPGYVEQNPDYYIPNNFLRPGKNALTINMEYSTQDLSAVIVLDWLEINYYRNFSADNDFIEFHKPTDQIDGHYQFEVTNFSSGDISIYKNESTRLTNFQKSYVSDNSTYSCRFQDKIASMTSYIAAGTESISAPDTCYLDTMMNIISIEGCDHLCIVAEEFEGDLVPLLEFYEEQGIDCLPVSISDIYNQFNHGIKSPYAIKRFLQQAYASWQRFPKTCLLIGDANLTSRDKDLLPTMLYQTYSWGGSASDYWYSLLSGEDNIPDIAIGRWACSDNEELDRLIGKRISYSKESVAGPWRNKYLFIAGEEDAFKEQTDYFTEYNIKPPATISRILVNPSNVSSRFYGGTDTLVNRINRGLNLVNFVGHGGGAIWSDRSLLRLQDLNYLNNEDYLTFITSFTCFTADFAAQSSLGEKITELESGGAIGLLGSSGVGWIINDFLLAREVLEYVQDDNLTVGDIINIGKINYLTRHGHYNYLKNSMVYQYNLLGDPTVKLSLPKNIDDYLKIETPQLTPGEALSVSGKLPVDQGNMELQIYDHQKYPITPVIPYYFSNADFSTSILLPDSSVSSGYINYVGANSENSQDFAGYIPFSVSQNTYTNLVITPEPISLQDSVYAEVEFLTEIDSLFFELDTAAAIGILQNQGVDTIYAFSKNAKSIHRIKFKQINKGKYQTTGPFIPKLNSRYTAYRLAWYENNEKFTNTPEILHINKPMDIELLSLRQGGLDFPAIEAELFLHGDKPVAATFTMQTELEDSVNYTVIHRTLTPNERQTVFLPIQPTTHRINGSVKVTGSNKESNSYNNIKYFDCLINHFQLSEMFGSSQFGQSNDTLWCDSTFFIYLAPNSIQDSAVISVTDMVLSEMQQPGIKPITEKMYSVSLSKPLSFITPLRVGFKSSREETDTKIIKYEKRLNGWVVPVSGDLVTEQFSTHSQYSLARVNDQQPPMIEVNFDGLDILSQNYVDAFPMISFIFHDENGVNFSANRMNIQIDDTEIGFNELIRKDTLSNFTDVDCSYRSSLESGTHTLQLSIQDAVGNTSEEEYQFKIFKDLQVMDYGNYPNPFQTRTWFVFETTKNVEEFKINIYATSGRKIRTIDDTNIFADKPMTSSGYHEVGWDGKDDFGDNIANGVYYYKMIAKTRDKTISKKGVIAKLK